MSLPDEDLAQEEEDNDVRDRAQVLGEVLDRRERATREIVLCVFELHKSATDERNDSREMEQFGEHVTKIGENNHHHWLDDAHSVRESRDERG